MLGALLFVNEAYAQQRLWGFERLGVDGNLGDVISVVYQDRMGFVWIGTQRGLFGYDGYTFQPYH